MEMRNLSDRISEYPVYKMLESLLNYATKTEDKLLRNYIKEIIRDELY